MRHTPAIAASSVGSRSHLCASRRQHRVSKVHERGLTLVELIVTVAILSILASAAVPIAALPGQAPKGARTALRPVDDARRHRPLQGRRRQRRLPDQGGQPELSARPRNAGNGVDVQGKKLKFLRRIPVDPMTGKAEWGLRSMQDDPDSDSYGGQSVFDVYSKSQGTALDGTKYATW